ncbi:hypothetical protein BDZ85DRAFT_264102 [Elsinoe ampelina]|uniref:Uncharacterized protein n=1 Tax=Elsinoe ampelina TaxID=302913 RepID=A0A6A6GAG7_9PEZI|nr:hypothetical protein BDZ85DRAFT_264102 [Elsinoe ampelina]
MSALGELRTSRHRRPKASISVRAVSRAYSLQPTSAAQGLPVAIWLFLHGYCSFQKVGRRAKRGDRPPGPGAREM